MNKKIKLHDLHFEVMIPKEEIDKVVCAVAQKINQAYQGLENPVVLGVLCGSYIFLSDLVRHFDFMHEVHFTRLSSYDGCKSTGEVCEILPLSPSLKGRHVIVVEDIIESGNTIAYLKERLLELEVESMSFCSLFLKPDVYKRDIKIDFVAKEIGEEFIVGYGLDYNEQGRSLKDVYVLCDE